VQDDLEKVLLNADEIAARVHELGEQISRDLESIGDQESIVIVPVLTGSIIFVADLIRQIPLKIHIEVIGVSSYAGKAMTSQGASIVGDLPENLEGKHVLIVDDILDSGGTISLLRQAFEERGAASIRACVLLRKAIDSARATKCEYVGFEIPDEFVVGYGLDYDNYYRNLPDVAILNQEAL
jgi:hypoxanthine phosphoribosyltransferase